MFKIVNLLIEDCVHIVLELIPVRVVVREIYGYLLVAVRVTDD